MTSPFYPRYEEESDQWQIDEAQAEIERLRTRYFDVIAIPDVITLVDVSRIVMGTPRGPVALSALASRAELVAVLRALEKNPCSDPEQVAYYTINDYRETRTSTSKES